MKIDTTTPRDQLLIAQKKSGRGFGWCLGLGAFCMTGNPIIGAPLLGGAVYFFLRKKKIADLIKRQNEEAAEQQQAEDAARRAELSARMDAWRASQRELSALLDREYTAVGHTSTHVVGTTFQNKDGSSRRYNLAFCYAGKKLEIRPFVYEGDPAYAVFSDDGQIGNLPATCSQEISEYGDDLIVTGEISQMLTDEYGDAYSCRVKLTIYQRNQPDADLPPATRK